MPPKLSPNDLTVLSTAWRGAGLDPEPIASTVDVARQRLDRLARQYDDLDATRHVQADAILHRLATGELDPTAAASALRDAPADPDQWAAFVALRRRAVETVCNIAHADLKSKGEALIVEHLAPAYAKLVARADALAPTVEGIEDDAAAMDAGPDVAAAWQELTGIVAARTALHAFLRAASPRGIIPALTVDVDYRTLARPDRKPSRRQGHPVRDLLALVASDAGPGIYTRTQAAEHAAQVKHAELNPEDDELVMGDPYDGVPDRPRRPAYDGVPGQL